MTSRAPATYLVAVDASDAAPHVLEVACGLGAALGGNGELHVVHVVSGPAVDASMLGPVVAPTADLEAAGRVVLDRAMAYASEHFRGNIAGHLASGLPWRAIVQLASSLSIDLVVVGSAGRTGLSRLMLGSVAEQVVRHAGCPVLVVRPKEHEAKGSVGIEPPCPDCVAVQKETQRAKLWCARHSEHHAHGQLHYELPQAFARGWMNFRPAR